MDPVDELFDKLIGYCSPSTALGKIDLNQAKLEIYLGINLKQPAIEKIMKATFLGVQWNWNLNSACIIDRRAKLKVDLRVIPPSR